ncbi:flagellar hook-length control protein FliK [Maricaulis sp. CAU 1757]
MATSTAAVPVQGAGTDATLPNAGPTLAQQGAPGVAQTAMGELPADMSAMDTAEGDIGLEAEMQGTRLDGRGASADRTGATLPRFAAHTAPQLAGQISRQFQQGNKVFDIRLDPAELGKVDVRLELRADNRVHAVLTAERPETLVELQRTARDLERALQDAGLDLAEDGLEFEMGDFGDDTAQQGDENGDSLPIFTSSTPAVEDEKRGVVETRDTYGFLISRRDGVDVRI